MVVREVLQVGVSLGERKTTAVSATRAALGLGTRRSVVMAGGALPTRLILIIFMGSMYISMCSEARTEGQLLITSAASTGTVFNGHGRPFLTVFQTRCPRKPYSLLPLHWIQTIQAEFSLGAPNFGALTTPEHLILTAPARHGLRSRAARVGISAPLQSLTRTQMSFGWATLTGTSTSRQMEHPPRQHGHVPIWVHLPCRIVTAHVLRLIR